MGVLSLLQGILPTQGSNPGLLHCRQILYQLSHKGSPVYTFLRQDSISKIGQLQRESEGAGRIGVLYCIIDFGRHFTPQVLPQYLRRKYKWLKV